jgi:hypothetical protein
MSYGLDSVRPVHTQYGARATGGGVGTDHSQTKFNRLIVEFTGESLASGFVPPASLRNGVTVLSALLQVTEAFSVASSSVLEIGEDGAEVTNGVSITEANLESVGVTNVSAGLAGEWAVGSKVTGPIDLGITFSAGSVSNTAIGKAQLIIEYVDLAV